MPDDVAVQLGEALVRNKLKLAIAESCTGGLASKMVTDVPGSSRYFVGSLCTYSNQAKLELLGISEKVLMAHGAVSMDVAREMALRAAKLFSAQAGIGITGIAGPGGSTEKKPIGLVYIVVVLNGDVAAAEHRFKGGRESVREQAARAALSQLLDKVNSA